MTEAEEKSEHQEFLTHSKKNDDQSLKSEEPKAEVLSQEKLEIIDWLKNVKFQKTLIGGINEQDVWKKIHQLNEKFEAALKAERVRYDVLLQEQRKNIGYSSSSNKDSEEIS